MKARLSVEKAKEKPDTELIEDILTAIDFLEDEFAERVRSLESLLEHGEMTYDLLWALFPPRTVVFSDSNLLREPQAASFSSGSYEENAQGWWYQVNCRMLHSDGDIFGWGTPIYKIPAFEGSKKIVSLAAYPLKHHPDSAGIRSLLLERGRRYIELVKAPICQEYQGLAVYQDETMGKLSEKRFTATGRVMVDPPAFQSQSPNAEDLLRPWVFTTSAVVTEHLTDDDIILCNHRILGFSFVQKRVSIAKS